MKRGGESAAREGCLIVISGPSGAGKGTLLSMVMEGDDKAVFSTSATTRHPREMEVDGKDYYFIDDNKFRDMIVKGEFLEYANVFGTTSYGTPKAPVLKSMKAGYDVYLDIDVQGAIQVKKTMPEAILIFIMTPSKAELERRLRDRATESETAISRRLETAWTEMGYAKNYDYIIINDNAQIAAADIRGIIRAEKCKTPRMSAYIKNWR